jgi:hypothetical protein
MSSRSLGWARQETIERYMTVLPGLAMSMSETPEIKEQGFKILKKGLYEFDTMPIEWLHGRDFIKAHPEVFELVDAEKKRRQRQWDVLGTYWDQRAPTKSLAAA